MEEPLCVLLELAHPHTLHLDPWSSGGTAPRRRLRFPHRDRLTGHASLASLISMCGGTGYSLVRFHSKAPVSPSRPNPDCRTQKSRQGLFFAVGTYSARTVRRPARRAAFSTVNSIA